MSSTTFYKWRTKYAGMDASLMTRMKELKNENRQLKKMYAEYQMQAYALKEALGKSGKAISAKRDGQISFKNGP
jgi:putative transposase